MPFNVHRHGYLSPSCLGSIRMYYSHISTTGQVSLAPAVLLIIYITDAAALSWNAQLLVGTPSTLSTHSTTFIFQLWCPSF